MVNQKTSKHLSKSFGLKKFEILKAEDATIKFLLIQDVYYVIMKGKFSAFNVFDLFIKGFSDLIKSNLVELPERRYFYSYFTGFQEI